MRAPNRLTRCVLLALCALIMLNGCDTSVPPEGGTLIVTNNVRIGGRSIAIVVEIDGASRGTVAYSNTRTFTVSQDGRHDLAFYAAADQGVVWGVEGGFVVTAGAALTLVVDVNGYHVP